MATLSRSQKKQRVAEIFEHCRREVLTGAFKCNVYEATRLAAYALQIELGDHDDAAAKLLTLDDLASYFPPEYAQECKKNEKVQRKRMLVCEWQSLLGTKSAAAKLRFARICRSSPAFGVHFFACRWGPNVKKRRACLLGFSKKELVILDNDTREVVQTHPLTHVAKWHVTAEAAVIEFRDYSLAQIAVQLNGTDTARQVSVAITSQMKKCIERKKEERRRSLDAVRGETVDDSESTADASSGMCSIEDDGDGSDADDTVLYGSGLGNLQRQSGFLKGFNRTTQMFATSELTSFNMTNSAMQTLSRNSKNLTSAPADSPTSKNDGKFELFLDEASEDVTASAAVLDSVARLGPNRTNPKWCTKMRNKTRVIVRQQVLGVASKCKQLMPVAIAIASGKKGSSSVGDIDKVTAAASVFTSALPPLAGEIVKLSALTTLSGKGEEMLKVAGDLWIGVLQLLQAIRHKSETDVKGAAEMIAPASKTLLGMLPILTAEDLARSTDEKTRKEAAALEAQAKVEEAIREVERMAKVEADRKAKEMVALEKQKLEQQKEAEREAEKRRQQEQAAARRKAKEAEAARKKEQAKVERERRRKDFRASIDKFETLGRR